MLVCIPTKGNAGLEDTVHEHFGSAPFFTMYDSESGELSVIENRNAHHSHGTCHPMNQLAGHKIDCVVCGGMGRRAVEALNAEGIKIYHSGANRVSEVVERVKTGQLTEIDPAKACRGHGQHPGGIHGFVHGHATDHGRGSGQGPGGRNRHGNGGRGNGQTS